MKKIILMLISLPAYSLFTLEAGAVNSIRKTVNVMTSGTTDIDVFSLKYASIPRPIYPLDEIESWR